MATLKEMERNEAKNGFAELVEKTHAYQDGKINMNEYKAVSGRRGTFSQRGKKKNMARIRMTGGRICREDLRFLVDTAKKYDVDHIHLATCQSIQLHDISPEQVAGILQDALEAGIVCFGTGGNFPRNIMCSPLSGVDPNEYFDVMPYALAAGKYLTEQLDNPEMPKKLKTAFSGAPDNITHVTYRDLGFEATPEGTFNVYAAGGLGPNPRVGVKVAENVDPDDILYHINAMVRTFQKYGANKDQNKRRTRYMVEALGGDEGFRKAYTEILEEVKKDPSLKLQGIVQDPVTKVGDGSVPREDYRVIPQRQEGLYAVKWHPIAGRPPVDTLDAVACFVEKTDQAELRNSPYQSLYILNLTGDEANEVLDIIDKDSAHNDFESSVACAGSSICQIGLRDSQALVEAMVRRFREEGLPGNVLPLVHVSGCRNSCGAHQTAKIGFQGFFKMEDKKPMPAFDLCLYGSNDPEHSKMGKMIGAILTEDIPEFLIELGKTVEASGKDYDAWVEANPTGVEEIARKYIDK